MWYNRAEPNPNVICGGLVGGPDKNDGFSDDRSNYEQTEPTISGSAPLVGIFAKLQILYGNVGEGEGQSPFYTDLLCFFLFLYEASFTFFSLVTGYNHNQSPVTMQQTPSEYYRKCLVPHPR